MASTDGLPARPSSGVTIDVLKSDSARVFTHVHAILVLSLFYIRFGALVAEPVPSLLSSLLPLLIIQLSYVITCLPVAGAAGAGSSSKAPPPRSAQQQRKRHGAAAAAAAKAEGGIGSRLTVRVSTASPHSAHELTSEQNCLQSALLSTILSLSAGTPILTVLMILFGAPVTTHVVHTLLASTHLSVLAIMPLVYVHGVDGNKWKDVISATSPLDEVFGSTVGTLLGAWLGAVPIPLDWDREWQKWPVTILTGAYAGYVVGKLAGGYLLKGVKIKFD
ncbi:MAG: Glycosylphosphatidylinositol (GPI) anchor assembly protein [Sclerophora amabilis]|nr:MAG: Glycosylphosphatidylinositol (GPI) anchor assembly protein [Sclerophora amabilis]